MTKKLNNLQAGSPKDTSSTFQSEPPAKRHAEYKSNSFSLLLKQPQYALEIFNYLNNTEYSDPSIVEIIEIDDGIKLSVASDSLFIIASYINIYEHQSTVNPNMPLRILIYVTNAYKDYIKSCDIYGRAMIKIPTPRLVVFYNGEELYPEFSTLKLSDAFINQDSDPCLELICKVYNINPTFNNELKSVCPSLNGYTNYVERVRKHRKTLPLKDAISTAIDECISDDCLAEFFKEYREMIIDSDVLDYTFEARLEMNSRQYKNQIEKLETQIAEKDSALAEKDSALAEKDRLIAELTLMLEQNNSK